MKSKNPNSGCREVDVAKTLDCFDPNPSKNQGGIAIVQSVGFKSGQGSKARSIGRENEKCPTLAAQAGGNSTPAVCVGVAESVGINGDIAGTLDANYFKGCGMRQGTERDIVAQRVCVKCYDARGNGDGENVCTMTGDHNNRITDYTALVCEEHPVFCIQGNCIDRANTAGCNGRGWTGDKSYTLNTIDRPAVAFASQMVVGTYSNDAYDKWSENDKAPTIRAAGGICGGGSESIVAAIDCRNGTENPDLNGTLQTKSNGGTSLNLNNIVRVYYIVRRLTPLECERLQGFPDGWTDMGAWTDLRGKTHAETADSLRYKALGNSIALPPWFFVLKRLTLACGADNTMASLFDGIGGFTLLWTSLNDAKSCVWGSEIEDFPIAVTTRHFKEVSD